MSVAILGMRTYTACLDRSQGTQPQPGCARWLAEGHLQPPEARNKPAIASIWRQVILLRALQATGCLPGSKQHTLFKPHP